MNYCQCVAKPQLSLLDVPHTDKVYQLWELCVCRVNSGSFAHQEQINSLWILFLLGIHYASLRFAIIRPHPTVSAIANGRHGASQLTRKRLAATRCNHRKCNDTHSIPFALLFLLQSNEWRVKCVRSNNNDRVLNSLTNNLLPGDILWKSKMPIKELLFLN